MSDPREVEIKLDLGSSAAEAAASRAIKSLGAGPGRREKLSSVYFDTADRVLRRSGLSLRVRTTKRGKVQTLKAGGRAAGGLFDRSEWETPVAGPGPDLDALAETPVSNALPNPAALEPVFETVVDRTIWVLTPGSSTVEVALDRGRVVAGADSRKFAEIELELKQGRPADLFDLARQLGADQPVRLGVVTKSERGYALVDGRERSAFKAKPIELSREQTAAQAFRDIASACLQQFRRNETILLEKRNIEALHEARVGLRRLRSALSLFKSLVDDDALPRLKAELRRVSHTLGDARNIDVYLEHAVLPEREREADEPGLTAFVDRVRTLREQAYDRAIAALDDPGFRALTIDLLAWVEAGPWATTDDPLRTALRDRPVARIAAEILQRRFRKVKTKGRHLAKLDPSARHRVRIDAKKLRYAAEFFAGLTAGKTERRRHDAFIKAMKNYQELLGDLNDLHTGHELALEFADKADLSDPRAAQSLFAAGHLSGEQDAQVAALLADAKDVHEEFARQPKFWRAWAD